MTDTRPAILRVKSKTSKPQSTCFSVFLNLTCQSHRCQEARPCSDKYWLQSSSMCLVPRQYTAKDKGIGTFH